MRRIAAALIVTLWACGASAQEYIPEFSKIILTNLATAAGTSCVAIDASGNVSKTGAACASGDITGVSFTLPSIFSAVSACTSGDCAFTFSLANQSAYTVFARGSGTGAPSFQTLAKSHVPAATVYTDKANTFGASYTQTFSGPIAVNNGVASHLIPSLTDTYNLGSSTKLWNEGFLSQINAVIFAESTATLFGGYSIVGKNAGTFPARVASADTQVNFGKAMTPGHFIAIRAHDEGGSLPTAEFMQVGALVSGTTYNVTRNLSGLGAKNWPSGTSYLVSGTTGDGRIELRAYSTPQISILSQGATYNAQTEHIRLGYLDGMPGMATGKIGLYIGDLGTSGMAYYDGVLQVTGTITGGTVRTAASGARTEMSGSTLFTHDGTNVLIGLSPTDGMTIRNTSTVGYPLASSLTYASTQNSGTTVIAGAGNVYLHNTYGDSTGLNGQAVMQVWDAVSGSKNKVSLDLTANRGAAANTQSVATLYVHEDFGGSLRVNTLALYADRLATSGGLVVDTSTLYVDATNNRVGIGTASPAAPLDVIAPAANGTKYAAIVMRVGADGTLGPTGVAIGAMPSATGGSRYGYIEAGDSGDYRPIVLAPSGGWVGIGGLPSSLFSVIGLGGTAAGASGAVPLQIDSSGNVKYVNNGATGTCANVTVVNGIVTGCS